MLFRLYLLYMCIAFAIYNTYVRVVTNNVTGEGGQYFRVRPRNSSVLEGGEVMIPCEVGNRVGIVQWVKDGFAYVIQPSK